ncbi:MAG: serine hydrolase, partial [Ilumatobacteraceae bacterium]
MDVSSPAAQGVDAEGIASFLDAIESDPRIEPHGLIIQRHGTRIAEGYWAPHTGDRSRLVYSLSKSFTGTALGLQIGEGRLSLDDLVSDHLPELFDDATADSARTLRIRHISSMSTGHDHETLLEAFVNDPTDAVRGFLAIPSDAEPGTLFMYNQPPVLALARILQRLAGESLVDYLRPRVLDPLGIGDFRWQHASDGMDLGFSGVYTNLDAVARLGQLYLDDGVWDGTRLLPEGFVSAASSVQIANPERAEPDWSKGYGFQLWMSSHGYRGDGAFGQYMLVLPEHDAVIAMFSCIETMQIILDLVWEHLLPAMDGPGSAAADTTLAERMATLALPVTAQRIGGAPVTDLPSMSFTRRPVGASHSSITRIDTMGDRMTVHEGERSFDVPLTAGWSAVSDSISASTAQLDDGRVAVDLAVVATPHRLEIDLDPASGTFLAQWPLVPLFGVGIDPDIASMR